MDQFRELRDSYDGQGQVHFLHVFDWPPPACEIAGIEARVMSVHLLANGRTLTFRQTEGKLQIDIPQGSARR